MMDRDGARHGMVGWYSPGLLLRTGFRAVIARVIGEQADNREIQAALNPLDATNHPWQADYSSRSELVLDYVSDLGDGWLPTYAVARVIATPELILGGKSLRRADVVVMGGDQVYPAPSEAAYSERTIAPYAEACEAWNEAFHADLFALPENHDWYHGLREFTEVYCRQSDAFLVGEDDNRFGWRTPQTRSYFALRLPHRWWFCGLDVQLDHRLNATQRDYFIKVARECMEDGDRVILGAALPSWVLADDQLRDATRNLTDVEQIFSEAGAQLKLVLSGDLHHFSHYEPVDGGPHLVTSGGGGAFTHPTHVLPRDVSIDWRDTPRQMFSCRTRYPSPEDSKGLSYRLLLFPFTNTGFTAAIGGIYALLSWFLVAHGIARGETFPPDAIGDAFAAFFAGIPASPGFALTLCAVAGGLVALNVGVVAGRRIGAGLTHAVLHFLALVASYCGVIWFMDLAGFGAWAQHWWLVMFLLLMTVSGALLGGLVFGVFLLFSLNVLGFHWTNAFSALRLQGHKNFIPLHLVSDGVLHVHAVGLDETNPRRSKPRLVDDPFTLR